MMDLASNTLFDRLVATATTPATGFRMPVEAVFERRGQEEVTESESQVFVPAGAPQYRQEGPAEFATSAAGTGVAENAVARSIQSDVAPEEPRPSPTPDRQTVAMIETPVVAPRLRNRPPEEGAMVQPRTGLQPQTMESIRVEWRKTPNAPRPPTVAAAPGPVEALRESIATVIVEPNLQTLAPQTWPLVSAPQARERRENVLPVVQPALPLMVPGLPQEQHRMDAPPQEPVIHVTIGRLEIRSGEKEKPARYRERTSQGASLEQYLAQRRKGAS